MNTQNNSIQVLHFSFNEVLACIDMQNVQKILQLVYLEPVPSAPNYVAGLLNYSGSTIPVIDLTLRLNMPRQQKYTLDTPILLCKNHNGQIGLIVDRVHELTEANQSNTQYHDAFKTKESPYIASVLYRSDLSLLLNIDHIIESSFNFEMI